MKLLHLYHDFMNLYGDYANVSAMERILRMSGEECRIDRLSFGDNAVFSDYDFIYIGSGTERNQKIVLEDMKKYRVMMKEYIDSGRVMLMTGNSFEMLGKTLTAADGTAYEGLGCLDFTVTEQDKTRNTADAIFTADFLDKPLVGFINKCSEIDGVEEPLFTVKMGLGNARDDKAEGVRMNHLFGTHLTGPVLIKNPRFLEYLAGLILGNESKLSTKHLGFERSGYDVTLSELTKRMNSEA